MPGRLIPLVTNEIYHVFNRGINHCPTFVRAREYEHAMEIIRYYRFIKQPVRLSYFNIWSEERRRDFMQKQEQNGQTLVDIISYCLMPNHFHFLLRQKVDNGIAKFLGNFQNSYTRYFNIRNQRDGSLFLDQFKAVRIETDEQFLHVCRYIHLNPYTSFVVKTWEALKTYPWSSFPEYLDLQKGFCETEEILSNFKSRSSFEKFTYDQADYQRELDGIKHLIIEKI